MKFLSRLTAAVLLSFLFVSAFADESSEPFRYRYWMVPTEKIGSAPWGLEKYYPVPLKRFETWISALRRLDKNRENGTLGLQSISLEASLSGGALNAGEGRFTFSQETDESEPFALTPCGIAVSGFRWENDEKAEVDSDGIHPALVKNVRKGGNLTFVWSLAPQSIDGNTVKYEFRLPRATSISLRLTLPDGLEPSADSGIATQVGSKGGTQNEWLVEPGPSGVFHLTISEKTPAQKDVPRAGVSEQLACTVSLEGIDLTYTAKFDSSAGLPETLSLLLNEPFLPERLFWKSKEGEANAIWEKTGRDQKIVVLVPPFAPEEEAELTLTAFAPFVSNSVLSLPPVHTDPAETTWKETKFSASFVSPITPQNYIFLDSGRIFSTRRSVSGNEEAVFQLFAQNGRVDIPLIHIEENAQCDSATEIIREDDEIRVESDLLLKAVLPGTRRVSIPIKQAWKPESAIFNGEPVPFRVENAEGGNLHITLAFREPLPTEEYRRVRITGRGAAPEAEAPISEYFPLVLKEPILGEHFLAFRAESPIKVMLLDESGAPIQPPAQIEEKARTLFGKMPEGPILSLTTDAPEPHVRFDKTAPAYTADISGKITAAGGRLEEEWLIRCVPPPDTRIDRILTSFSLTDIPDVPWMWSISESGVGTENRLAEPILSEGEKKILGTSSSRRYGEITLPTPRSVPFTVRIHRERPADFTQEVPIPLLSLPDTPNQNAEIGLWSPDFSSVRAEVHEMNPISSPPTSEYETETSFGAYTYRSGELASRADTGVTLSIRPDTSLSPQSWCRFYRLESECSPDGSVRNRAVCLIENAGSRSVHLRFPKPFHISAFENVMCDGVPIKYSSLSDNGVPCLEIPIPLGKKYVTLTVEYRDMVPQFRFRAALPKRVPELDIPVLSGEWVTRIPMEYEEYAARSFTCSRILPFLTNQKFPREDLIRNRAEKILERLGDAKPAPTLYEFLTNREYIPSLFDETPELLIHLPVVDRLGITANQLLAGSASFHSEVGGADALRRNGLVLILFPRGKCLLTSPETLDQFTDLLIPISCESLWYSPSSIPQKMELDSVSVEDWKKAGDRRVFQSPWTQNTAAFSPGWVPGRLTHVTPIESSTESIRLINRYRLGILQWFLFLAALLLGTRIRVRFSLLFAAAALVLCPASTSTVVSASLVGIFFGLFAGGLYRLAQKKEPDSLPIQNVPGTPLSEIPEEESEPGFVLPEQRPGSSSTASGSAFLLLLAGLFLLLSTAAKPAYADSQIYPVFVPCIGEMADENEPAWIPAQLYRRMTAWERGVSETKNGARIESAVYEGFLNYNRDTGEYSLFRLTAKYRVFTDNSDCTLHFPKMPMIPEGGVLIDGVAGNISFTDEKEELRIEIHGIYPGSHTLELILLPDPFNEKEEKGTEIMIPAVPDSKLLLRIPSDIPVPKIEGGLGEVAQSPGILTADLGQISRFTLKSPSGGIHRYDASVETDQDFLLQIEEQRILLRGEFRLRIGGGKRDGVMLLTDPRYALTRCVCDEASLLPTPAKEIDSGRIWIPFKRPVSGSITLRAEFVPRDFGGIGALPIPAISIADSSTARNQLRIAAAPSLDVSVSETDLTPQMFSDSNTGESPNESGSQTGRIDPGLREIASIELGKGEGERIVSIRPAQSTPIFSESAAYTFQSRGVDAVYTADIDTRGPLFQLTVKKPAVCAVQELTVTSDDKGESVHLHRTEEGNILRVFFDRPLRGKYKLEIRARIGLSVGVSMSFPLIGLDEFPCNSSNLKFDTSNSLYSDFTPPLSWLATSSEGRAKQWELPGSAASILPPPIEVKPNTPKLSLHSESYFYPRLDLPAPDSGSLWELLTDFSLAQESGELDKLTFDLDDGFNFDNITIDSEIPFTRKEARTDTGKRLLVLTPETPLRQGVRLRFSGLVQRETPRLPLFRFRSETGLQNENRKIFLAQRGGRDFTWRTENLSPSYTADTAPTVKETRAENYFPFGNRDYFPKQITEDSGLKKEEFAEYRPTDSTFSAFVESEKGNLEVIGSETSYFIRADGSYYGQTIMDVRIGSASGCVLDIPDGVEILHTSADGIPAHVTETDDGRRRLDFIHETPVCRLCFQFQAHGGWLDNRIIVSKNAYSFQRLRTVNISGIVPRGSLWAIVFESALGKGLPCYAAQSSDSEPELPLRKIRGSFPHESAESTLPADGHWKYPISFDAAESIFVRLNMAKMSYMLNLLENLGSFSGSDGQKNWYARWYQKWEPYDKEVSRYFSSNSVEPFAARQRNAIFQEIAPPNVPQSVNDPKNLLSMAAREDYEKMNTRYEELVRNLHLPDLSPSDVSAGTPEPLWFASRSEPGTGILFGLTNRGASEIHLLAPNPVRPGSWYRTPLLGLALLLLLLPLWGKMRARRKERRNGTHKE